MTDYRTILRSKFVNVACCVIWSTESADASCLQFHALCLFLSSPSACIPHCLTSRQTACSTNLHGVLFLKTQQQGITQDIITQCSTSPSLIQTTTCVKSRRTTGGKGLETSKGLEMSMRRQGGSEANDTIAAVFNMPGCAASTPPYLACQASAPPPTPSQKGGHSCCPSLL